MKTFYLSAMNVWFMKRKRVSQSYFSIDIMIFKQFYSESYYDFKNYSRLIALLFKFLMILLIRYLLPFNRHVYLTGENHKYFWYLTNYLNDVNDVTIWNIWASNQCIFDDLFRRNDANVWLNIFLSLIKMMISW